MIIHPCISSSAGSDIDSISLSAEINAYAACSVSYHEGAPGARNALDVNYLSRRAQLRQTMRANPMTPNFSASIAGIPGADELLFRGFITAPGGTNQVGNLSRTLGAVHASALISHLHGSIYSLNKDIVLEKAEEITGTLTERLIAITDSIVEEGRTILQGSDNPLADGLKKADTANRLPLQAWRAMLQASEETVGYDDLADLPEDAELSKTLNMFLYAQILGAKADFFQTVQAIASAFGLFYRPGIKEGDFGSLCSPRKMLENAQEFTLDAVMTGYQDGARNGIVPEAVLISGLPFSPSSDPFKWGTLSLGDPGGVVFPADATGPLVEIGVPGWIPTVFPQTEPESGNILTGSNRFSEPQDPQQEIIDEFSKHIEEAAPIINEYVQNAWYEMVTASSSAMFDCPLAPDIAAGMAVKLTIPEGGSLTGIVSSVRHTVSVSNGGGTASTNFTLSYLND